MAHKFFEDKIPHNGYTYDEFHLMTQNLIDNTNTENLGKSEIGRYNDIKLNQHRSNRIYKHYEVSDEVSEEISKIDEKQIWMVITENWCGDSAQSLPYIAKIASLNNNIDLRIVLRDSHPEIMDLYLTNGTRSIPKMVGFDMEGNAKFKWGPRPEEAQKLMNQWKAEGVVKPELYEKLHLWYSKDKGKNIEKEILQLVKKINLEVV
ncbi:MAG: thioredoxin family protein [Ignavibacteriaceae bacterium]|jgi:hypothetical protein